MSAKRSQSIYAKFSSHETNYANLRFFSTTFYFLFCLSFVSIQWTIIQNSDLRTFNLLWISTTLEIYIILPSFLSFSLFEFLCVISKNKCILCTWNVKWHFVLIGITGCEPKPKPKPKQNGKKKTMFAW